MPLYRGGLDMYKKYSKKYVPDTIGARFGQVQDVALDRAQEGLITVGTVRDLVRPILDSYGITGGLRATYMAFGLALARHSIRQKGEAAKKIATALKNYFVSAYDLDPSICDEIINVVTGWVAPY